MTRNERLDLVLGDVTWLVALRELREDPEQRRQSVDRFVLEKGFSDEAARTRLASVVRRVNDVFGASFDPWGALAWWHTPSFVYRITPLQMLQTGLLTETTVEAFLWNEGAGERRGQ